MTTAFSWDYIEHTTRRQLAEAGRACVVTMAQALEPGAYERSSVWEVAGDGDGCTVSRNGVMVHGPGAVTDDEVFVRIAVEIGGIAPSETPRSAPVRYLEVLAFEQAIVARAA